MFDILRHTHKKRKDAMKLFFALRINATRMIEGRRKERKTTARVCK
jgi:hypothetical protein